MSTFVLLSTLTTVGRLTNQLEHKHMRANTKEHAMNSVAAKAYKEAEVKNLLVFFVENPAVRQAGECSAV